MPPPRRRQPRSAALDAKEVADLELGVRQRARGASADDRLAPAAQGARRRDQKQRAKRFVRDALDRSLLDLASFYRDVMAVQLGTSETAHQRRNARRSRLRWRGTRRGRCRPSDSRAIFATREALEGEVAPVLALESLMISLRGAHHD